MHSIIKEYTVVFCLESYLIYPALNVLSFFSKTFYCCILILNMHEFLSAM